MKNKTNPLFPIGWSLLYPFDIDTMKVCGSPSTLPDFISGIIFCVVKENYEGHERSFLKPPRELEEILQEDIVENVYEISQTAKRVVFISMEDLINIKRGKNERN